MSIQKLLFVLSSLFFGLQPTLSFSQSSQALDIAIRHLEEVRASLDLTTADIADYAISDHYVSQHNGVTHIYLQQQYQSIRVFNALTNINVLPDGKVLNMGCRFLSDLAARVNTTQAVLTPAQAVQSVLQHFEVQTRQALQFDREEDAQTYFFKPDGISQEPIKVQLMYQPLADGTVRLAWNVDIYELSGQNWYIVRVDAISGKVLDYYNQVIHCQFGNHTAETDHVCEAIHQNAKHAPMPEKTVNFENPPVDVSNVYNVLPMPVESPNHGERILVIEPANVVASPFGWHDVDGMPGADYTITRGNNVHSYQDILSLNVSIDDEPDGGDSLVFDYPFDPADNFPYKYIDAAITNMFYWSNLMHDVWWHYGFDEPSGNFQQNNYGNGGFENDYLRAETLDGSGTNNANYSGGPDGQRSRVQMFVWGDDPLPPNDASLEVVISDTTSAALGSYEAALSVFGADISVTPLEGEIVIVDDGEDPTSDACQEIQNGADLVGKIALIDRSDLGDCGFGLQVLKAQAEGAIAAIVCNDGNFVFSMFGGTEGGAVNIPSVMISEQSCNKIKSGLADTTVQAQIGVFGDLDISTPGPEGYDSDWDNGVIVHEYTHGISIRLTGGASQTGCLTNMEQAGEGWSDWFAIVMTASADDDPNKLRGVGTYSTNVSTMADGIRTHPYSRDMGVNPHTYFDINTEFPPHGVGSVWCAMIWDLYWNLVDLYGFDEDFYNGTGGNNKAMQLVMDGLKLQPCNPNFIEARDAVLAADVANFNGEHQCLIWKTFARRGLGFGAMPGGNQAFDLPPQCTPFLKFTKSAVDVAALGDILTYTLIIRNDSPDFLAEANIIDVLPVGTNLVAGSSSCGGSVDNGVLTIPIGNLDTGDQIMCTYQLEMTEEFGFDIQFEDGLEQGAKWKREANVGDEKWRPTNQNVRNGTFAWHAQDVNFISDQVLRLKDSLKLGAENPALAFWHDYALEEGIDGGIVEITADGGVTWEDLGPYIIQNTYSGMLNPSDNPLAGKQAFTGVTGEYIRTIIDLSTWAGQNIRVRFRCGTDSKAGDRGWYIDDITFYKNLLAISNEACLSTSNENLCAVATTIIDNVVSGTEDTILDSQLSIFPNPTNDKIQIRLNAAEFAEVDLRVLSIDGRLLKIEKMMTNEVKNLNLKGYGKGVYFIQISTEKAMTTRRMIVH